MVAHLVLKRLGWRMHLQRCTMVAHLVLNVPFMLEHLLLLCSIRVLRHLHLTLGCHPLDVRMRTPVNLCEECSLLSYLRIPIAVAFEVNSALWRHPHHALCGAAE